MNKQKSITSFFKRKELENDTTPDEDNPVNEDTPTRTHNHEEGPSIIDIDNVAINYLERDPGLRPPIWAYPIGKRNEIRRAYIKLGPYQPQLAEYPFSGPTKHRRRFQSTWFVEFPDWLEYSPSKDAAFCLPCYLFTETPNSRVKSFTLTGFKNWKKVNDGKHCGFLAHIGEGPFTTHQNAVQLYRTLPKQKAKILLVLEHISNDKSCNSTQRGDVDVALDLMISFDFVFIAHLMEEILGIANVLCQALQQKSQDIVSAVKLVSTNHALIQEMRENGWESFLESVVLFCHQHDILILDMNSPYIARRGRARHQQDRVTMNHFYRVEIFLGAIDKQLQELNRRFNDDSLELLTLSSLLEPKDGFKNFDLKKVCLIAEKFYPVDFTEQERYNLRYQLQHFFCEAKNEPSLTHHSTLEEFCEHLAQTGKSNVYFLFDRLIRLVLTLPVSTATTKRAFSAMKIMKTRLRNKMEDEFLADSLVISIERKISKSFSTKSIIDDFKLLKER
ncbi:uncharacterized protein LOC110701548 [Chenopodium quinoa]|uniref:uncharacterized protein LOC110701548 n=1 Tax=Chenopodium quinoa TaxID=63459 RepID=UPI000B784348|nr:uncharacterized protein LOC110701548 [Chenopodium quinoa]